MNKDSKSRSQTGVIATTQGNNKSKSYFLEGGGTAGNQSNQSSQIHTLSQGSKPSLQIKDSTSQSLIPPLKNQIHKSPLENKDHALLNHRIPLKLNPHFSSKISIEPQTEKDIPSSFRAGEQGTNKLKVFESALNIDLASINCGRSVSTNVFGSQQSLSQSGSTSRKKSYRYCIDTSQILKMLDYSIHMLSTSLSDTKSDQDLQTLHSPEEITRLQVFASGSQDILSFMNYLDYHLDKQQIKCDQKQGDWTQTKLNCIKVLGFDNPTWNRMSNFVERSESLQECAIKIDDKDQEGSQSWRMKMGWKFSYLIENEKTISNKLFLVQQKRSDYVSVLKDIHRLLSAFILNKYKNSSSTSIGFSFEKQLFNIFSQILSSQPRFFNQTSVRRVLSQFWLSVRDVVDNLKIKRMVLNGESSVQMSIQTVLNHQIKKLSDYEDELLKNNFYLRLELLARGRYIFDPFEHLFQLTQNYEQKCTFRKGSSSGISCDSSGNNGSSQIGLRIFPVHQAVFESNLRHLSKLLKQEVEGIFYQEKNQLDPCGNTPLMLAVKLGNIDAVKILTDMYTCPKLRPLSDLMNAKEIAIALKDQQILKILMNANPKIKANFFQQNKLAIFQILEAIPDFRVDLHLMCDSNWFSLFSSLAPSDTYKIYKQGSNLRLDMSLLGLQKFNLIKGNISVIFKGRGSDQNQQGDILVVDHKNQTVSSVFNKNTEGKINQEIQEILSGKQVLKKYETLEARGEMEKKGGIKTVNGFKSQKYVIKSKYLMIKYQMNLSQLDKIKGIKTFDIYLKELQLDLNSLLFLQTTNPICKKERISRSPFANFMKSKEKQIDQIADIDLQTAPLTQRQFLSSTHQNLDLNLKNGGFSSRENSRGNGGERQGGKEEGWKDVGKSKWEISQNKQIIIKKKSEKQLLANLWLSREFPVSIDQLMPLIHLLSFCSKQIRQFNKFLQKYQIPESHSVFPVEARIPLFMTMEAVFSFRNIQIGFNDSSVFLIDQEISKKQNENLANYAKQQIINLHSSIETLEDKQARALKEIYKLCRTDEGEQIDEENKVEERRGKSEESDSSDRVKQMFNEMILKSDDKEEDLNQLLDYSEQRQDQEESPKREGQSYSELKKKWRSGKTASKQISMQSDITETVEVSERSFNDKLAKLKIHSFKNVKFMSQLKKEQSGTYFTDTLPPSIQQRCSHLEEFQTHASKINNISKLNQNNILVSGGFHVRNGDVQTNSQPSLHIPKPQKSGIVSKGPRNLLKFGGLRPIPQTQSSSLAGRENIYDSKHTDERPAINLSIGKSHIANVQANSRQDAQRSHFGQRVSSKIDAIIGESNHSISNSTVFKDFLPNRIHQAKQTANGNIFNYSLGISQVDNLDETMGDSQNSNILQSMSSLFGNQPNHNLMQNEDVKSQEGDRSRISEARLKVQSDFGQKGPNSTADSSVFRGQGVRGTILSRERAGRRASQLGGTKGGVLNRPRYLNTIESEGNLPSQVLNTRQDTKNNRNNDLSKHSIQSLEYLPSEEESGSQAVEQSLQMKQRTGPENPRFSQIFSYEKRQQSQDIVNLEYFYPPSFQDNSRIKNLQKPSPSIENKNLEVVNKQGSVEEIQEGSSLKEKKMSIFHKFQQFLQESIGDKKQLSSSQSKQSLNPQLNLNKTRPFDLKEA